MFLGWAKFWKEKRKWVNPSFGGMGWVNRRLCTFGGHPISESSVWGWTSSHGPVVVENTTCFSH